MPNSECPVRKVISNIGVNYSISILSQFFKPNLSAIFVATNTLLLLMIKSLTFAIGLLLSGSLIGQTLFFSDDFEANSWIFNSCSENGTSLSGAPSMHITSGGANLIKNFYLAYEYKQGIGAIQLAGSPTHEIQLRFYLGNNRNVKKELKNKDEKTEG